MERKVILIPHCVLIPGINGNTNISRDELEEIIKVLLDSETGIVQLPCPHLSSIIAKNKGERSITTVENTLIKENKNNSYKKLYRKILEPVITEIEEYKKQGVEIIGVIGIKGSPICNVGVANDIQNKNFGLFMKILIERLHEKSIKIVMANI
jgi:predicted secreted protein